MPPIACIDAGSTEVSVVLTLQLPMSVLAMTYPVQTDSIVNISEEKLEDWISEISNQLIGRLKSKLLSHDCTALIGLPAIYFGTEIDDLLAENGDRHNLYFDIDGEACGCIISTEIFDDAPSFSLSDNNIELMAEGEIELF
ncbi:MAG: hypothetical protein HN790_02265 [Methylococcales bacterium]|jgi:hypothetical protein|nr:hypothetical protein [Methylococcales bacterium]